MPKHKMSASTETGKSVSKEEGAKVERKRKFREKKYKSAFGNQSEGHGFAEASKLKVIREYKRWQAKERKKERNKSTHDAQYQADTQRLNDQAAQGMPQAEQKKPSKKVERFQKAAKEAEQQKKEKES